MSYPLSIHYLGYSVPFWFDNLPDRFKAHHGSVQVLASPSAPVHIIL